MGFSEKLRRIGEALIKISETLKTIKTVEETHNQILDLHNKTLQNDINAINSLDTRITRLEIDLGYTKIFTRSEEAEYCDNLANESHEEED